MSNNYYYEYANYIKWALSLAMVLTFASCNLYKLPPSVDPDPMEPYEVGTFDFSTTKEIDLTVNYNITYPLLFEVYDENPMIVSDQTEVINENLVAKFKAITDDKGQFQGKILLPSSVTSIYLHTKYMGVPSVINIDIKANGAVLDLSQAQMAKTTKSGAVSSGKIVGKAMMLYPWDDMGVPLTMLPRRKLDGVLMNSIMYSLPESTKGLGATNDPHDLIKEDKNIANIEILKDTKVNLLFMHEGASMRNTLAYYTYPTDSPAKSADELQRIIAVPNFSYAYSGGALSSGDCVPLKYWNGSEFVDEFPAGTTIGWCMIAYAFDIQTANINARTTTNAFYSDYRFNPEKVNNQHCVALYDKNNKVIALGFEDQDRDRLNASGKKVSDDDFNDVVFYVETSVEGSIDSSNIPELIPNPTPEPNPIDNFIEYKGSLVFEDLWPSQGDYDMNDVIVEYHSTHYRNKYNQVVKVVDKFTPQNAGAGRKNGFGYQLGINRSAVYSVEIKSDYQNEFSFFKTDGLGMELNQRLATIMLFENSQSIVGQNSTSPNDTKSITVTITFNGPVKESDLTLPPYNPFVVCNAGSGERDTEVHLPNKKPTDLADASLLGTSSDKSNVGKNIYYISKENFMYALNLPVRFNAPAEKERIDQKYSRFASWVQSGGTKDTDWYLDAK